MNNKRPYISLELLDFLKKKYPLRPPNLNHTDRQIWAEAGVQKVINDLQQLHTIQESDYE